MLNYQILNLKIKKCCSKGNSLKMSDGNNLPHELLLTTRQKNKSKKCF